MLRPAALFLAVVSSIVALSSSNSAQPTVRSGKDFLVQNDDGYGTSDCLAKASACGKIVADAWCESKGFAKAMSYRPAESTDITSSATPSRAAMAESFVISCAE